MKKHFLQGFLGNKTRRITIFYEIEGANTIGKRFFLYNNESMQLD
jgi:hypothetical protein